MIKIQRLPREQFYNDLKNSFKDGIEFKRTPIGSYLGERTVNFEPDKLNLENIAEDLYVDRQSNIKNILNRTKTVNADWNAVTKIAVSEAVKNKIIDSGRSRFESAFVKGIKNPDVCLMALYDAIAEWALETARRQAGVREPVKVIREEVSKISSQIFKDENNKNAYNKLLKQSKKINPHSGKKRLKIIQKSYLLKIENGINEILKTMITPKN